MKKIKYTFITILIALPILYIGFFMLAFRDYDIEKDSIIKKWLLVPDILADKELEQMSEVIGYQSRFADNKPATDTVRMKVLADEKAELAHIRHYFEARGFITTWENPEQNQFKLINLKTKKEVHVFYELYGERVIDITLFHEFHY